MPTMSAIRCAAMTSLVLAFGSLDCAGARAQNRPSAQAPPPAAQPGPQAQPGVPPRPAPIEPSPEALKAAGDLVSIMLKDTLDRASAQSWPSIEAGIASAKLDAQTLAALHKQFDDIQGGYTKGLVADAAAIYAQHFTVMELRELTIFYRTPTGQKALKEMPVVTQQTQLAMAPRLQEVQAQTFLAFRNILRTRGYIK